MTTNTDSTDELREQILAKMRLISARVQLHAPDDLIEQTVNELFKIVEASNNQARIDELKYWQWKTDGHIELSGKEVDERLAQLQQKQGDQHGKWRI